MEAKVGAPFLNYSFKRCCVLKLMSYICVHFNDK
jgi:hypothetical protein